MPDPRIPPFWQFLGDWLRENQWTQTQLADEVGVHQTVVSKWLHSDMRRRVRPGPSTVPRLSGVLKTPIDRIARMLLEDQIDVGERRLADRITLDKRSALAPISTRIRSLDDELQRWMAVMGPGLGQEEAERLFWDARVRDARRQVDDVEAALQAAQRAITRPIEPVSRPLGGDDDAITGRYRSRTEVRLPLAA